MKLVDVLRILWMKFTNKQFIKFVIVGIINTTVTYVIYLLIISYINYNIAYSLAYIIGILLSYFLNAKHVFNKKINIRSFLKFPLVYLIQYLLNIILMNFFIIYLNVHINIAPALIIIISVPITFFLSRLVFKS